MWWVVRFYLLKLFSKRKKQKKKKAILTRGTGGKTKRKRNKSRRVAGHTTNSAKPPYLPCHYAVVFWLGGAVAVHLIFAIFCSFFNPFQSKKGYKKHVWDKYWVFLVCFLLSVQNFLNVKGLCQENLKCFEDYFLFILCQHKPNTAT